jgi:NADPH-dependent 2,4-dienoyl-CoA reductase/sulfur reductase-like enzyme
MSAAAKAKRVNRELDVVVFEKGAYISFAACGLPYLLAGDITEHRELIMRTPSQMAEQGVDVRIHHEVTEIAHQTRTVIVRDRERGQEFAQPYDQLVLATGARPVHPEVPGSDLEGVFALRGLDSGLAMQNYLSQRRPKQAVVVGGSYIGVEMAETLRRRGLEVTMVIRSGKVLRTMLDDDTRELVHRELENQGVHILHSKLVAFEGDAELKGVLTEQGAYPCDVVLLGMGAQPNVALARAAGIQTGPTGAIATDDHMCTNLEDVFAAGDCSEAIHLVTGQPAYIPLGTTANKQGRVAGTNAAGGSATFGGVVGTVVVRCFELAVAATGLTAASARATGFDVQETMIRASDISHYFPGAADIHVKLVVDRESGRLLGGQIVGKRGVAKRVDILATALHNQMTVADLQKLDLSYAPPFAPVWDPILVAANIAAK